MSLKTDYKDDIYEGSRRYRITPNDDGTSTITDATTYTQKGDKFGQNDVNAINIEINKIQAMRTIKLTAAGWSEAAPYVQTISVDGMTAADLPIPLLDVSAATNFSNEKLWRKQYGWISYYDTADGTITFTAKHRKPTVDLSIGLKGVG